MKRYAKRFLRDSLAILYFVAGWKIGGCLLSERPSHGEADRGPNHGADQFADEASHEPADATTNAPAPFVENILADKKGGEK